MPRQKKGFPEVVNSPQIYHHMSAWAGIISGPGQRVRAAERLKSQKPSERTRIRSSDQKRLRP